MAKCPICGKGFMYSFAKANDGTQLCGDESCKREYNKIALSRGSSSNSSKSNENYENQAELKRIEFEREQARKREAAEAQAKLDQKADVFRSQGKHFCALITQHLRNIQIGVLVGIAISFLLFMSNPILGVLLFIVVFGLIIFGSLKYWKELKR